VLPPPLRPLAAGPSSAALLVDYDGSLAPIVDDPAAAVVLPAARAALARVVPRLGRVAIVSGRPVDFLRANLPIDGLEYVGQYGLERLAGGQVLVDPRAEPYVEEVARLLAAARTELPDARVEQKGTIAIGLHWRGRPELEASVTGWARRAAADHGLECAAGRMAVELRPPVGMDKGVAVEELSAGFTAAAFAGDDLGDLPAFVALDRLVADGRLRHAVRIGVRSPEEPPEVVARADVHVDGPAGLAALLDELASSISSPRG
jgi:trehalose 6-phosphate phosphatase